MDVQKEREAFENHLKKMGKTDNETFSKNEDDSYQMDIIHFGWKVWQAAKADAVPELTDKIIVAIESEVESQLKASAIDADPFRLDGEKIWYAALEAQEPK